jgi:hypothetical protein
MRSKEAAKNKNNLTIKNDEKTSLIIISSPLGIWGHCPRIRNGSGVSYGFYQSKSNPPRGICQRGERPGMGVDLLMLYAGHVSTRRD